jgi:hemerythrin-like metal-binding protein
MPAVRKRQVAEAVDALGRATAAHFASEDAIMQAVDYPGAARHRQQHAELLMQYEEFSIHFRSPQGGSVALALRFLREWFEYHIEHYDAPLVAWLRELDGGRR